MNFFKKNIDISNLSNFKTKAFTKYYYEINNEKDILNLKKILTLSKKENLKVLFIGGGTNILFAFEIFDGIIIKNNLKGFNYNTNSKILEVYSSESIWKVAEILENDYGQNLWHRFIGLPGSIGGAIFGNAGCFGLEVEGNLIEVLAYDLEKYKIINFKNEEINFSYRNSIFKETGKYFIIKAKFDLSILKEKYSSDVDNIKFREEVQPKGNSCGSFFKNPSKEFSAGRLIEEVGLKGFVYNTAYFSEKHANFLMTNCDNGTYDDLLCLIDLAQKKVKEKFDIELEPEVRIIKN